MHAPGILGRWGFNPEASITFISKSFYPRFFLATIALLALPLAGAAEQVRPAGVTVEVVADDGRVLRQFEVASERDTRRAYLEATPGQRYGIRVRNHGRGRIGLVLAVDGRNIISGAKSHLQPTEPMYVLDPYQTATFDGWRTSTREVHRFFFTESADSYAGAFGDHSAMGVIAVAAYGERTPVPDRWSHLKERRRNRAGKAAPMPESAGRSSMGAPAEEADPQPGTGFGERQSSHVVRVHFEPQRQPFATHYYKYAWRETLIRLGYIHAPRPHNRFWPGEHRASLQEFSPYPPGHWKHR